MNGLCRNEYLTVDGAIGRLLDWTADVWGKSEILAIFHWARMRVQSTRRRRAPKEIDYAYIRQIALFSSEFLFFSFEFEFEEEMNKLVVFP